MKALKDCDLWVWMYLKVRLGSTWQVPSVGRGQLYSSSLIHCRACSSWSSVVYIPEWRWQHSLHIWGLCFTYTQLFTVCEFYSGTRLRGWLGVHTCFQGHSLGSYKRQNPWKIIGYPQIHYQSSTSTKLLITVKIHQNLHTWISQFKNFNPRTGSDSSPGLTPMNTPIIKPLVSPSLYSAW